MQKVLDLKTLIYNQEKLKMCKFPLTGCLQKICIFFRKTCEFRFLMSARIGLNKTFVFQNYANILYI